MKTSSYCVWAPDHRQVEVVIYDAKGKEVVRTFPLTAATSDYFTGSDPLGKSGDLYKYRLDGDPGKTFPDPKSQYQPYGVHGPSQKVDLAYPWQHDSVPRKAPSFTDLVIYELHIGTFTKEGTFLSAISKLDALVELGITAIEIMPIADFPGRWNWGYDGVSLYAPSRAYGTPKDLQTLIDAAHERGLSVILDVVYNHLGPDGNYLSAFSTHYFNSKHKTPWGDALNFDGKHSQPVRDFFLQNILYWMENFHVDGFRLDATHAIIDTASPRHILSEIADAVHKNGGFVIAEDERNDAALALSEAQKGNNLDAVWSDDFHHAVRVALTHEQDAYLQNFSGKPKELQETLTHGWLYRGQPTKVDQQPRGSECKALLPTQFVYCISNHDQVGNRAFGQRLHEFTNPAAYRAASALLCLSPYTPMLFMGQEWAATSPFLYFTDHNPDLGKLVTEGRRKEFEKFKEFSDKTLMERIPDPQAEATFFKSKLQWEERETPDHLPILKLTKAALALRHNEPLLRQARTSRQNWKVHVLENNTVAIDYFDRSEIQLRILFSLTGYGLISTPLPNADSWKIALYSNQLEFCTPAEQPMPADLAQNQLHFFQPGLVVLRAS